LTHVVVGLSITPVIRLGRYYLGVIPMYIHEGFGGTEECDFSKMPTNRPGIIDRWISDYIGYCLWLYPILFIYSMIHAMLK